MMTLPASAQSVTETPFPFRPIATLTELEALRTQGESALLALPPEAEDQRAPQLANLAGLAFILGDSQEAIKVGGQALEAAESVGLKTLMGYVFNTIGAAHAYNGQYERAGEAFEQAATIFSHTNDSVGMAWQQHYVARERARDCGQYGDAIVLLDAALPVLRSRGHPYAHIENLLTRTDCLLHLGELRSARDLLTQVEALINENKCFWYRPELSLIRVQVSMIENNYRTAWHHGYVGLGMVGNQGDLRLLSPLYLGLAMALEHDRSRLDDARDALERAITAGRTRARRLHLALALRQMGLHLKRFSNRPTVRARGAGFLFESSKMLREMNVLPIYAIGES